MSELRFELVAYDMHVVGCINRLIKQRHIDIVHVTYDDFIEKKLNRLVEESPLHCLGEIEYFRYYLSELRNLCEIACEYANMVSSIS